MLRGLVAKRSLRVVLAGAALTLAAAPAGAEDPAARARAHFVKGEAAFKAGDFAEAAREFEEAAQAKLHAFPLINAGDAWERAGDPVRAAGCFERAAAVPGASAADRTDAQSRLRKLEAQLARIEVELPPGEVAAVARVDGAAVDPSTWVKPGRHAVAMRVGNETREKSLELGAGTTTKVRWTDLPAPAAAPAPGTAPAPEPPSLAEPARPRLRTPTWIGLGATAVGAGLVAYFGWKTQSAAASYDEKPNVDDRDAVNRNRTATNIALAGTGAAAIAAGVLLYVDLRRPSAAAGQGTRGTVVAAPTSGGAWVGVGGRF